MITMITLTGAYYVGQIITQEQLDLIDVDSMDLGEHFVKNEDGSYKIECKEKICNFFVDINSISSIYNTTDYEIIEKEYSIRQSIPYWKKFKQKYGTDAILGNLTRALKMERDNIEEEEKKEIKNYQTKELVGGLFDGLDLE